jgi:hypothetical protein
MAETGRLEGGQEDDLLSQRSQNTARIARAIGNGAVCRTFLRSVSSIVYRLRDTITDRSRKYRPRIDRLEMSRSAGLSSSRRSPRSMRSVFWQLY